MYFSYTVSSLILIFCRAFPGLFAKKLSGKKRPHSTLADLKRRINPVKCFPVQFYLVNKYMEKTPKTSEELTLLQAGMGRRTVSVNEDADHSWVNLHSEWSENLFESPWQLDDNIIAVVPHWFKFSVAKMYFRLWISQRPNYISDQCRSMRGKILYISTIY